MEETLVCSTQNNRNSDTIEPSYSNEDFNIGKSNRRIYKLTYGKDGTLVNLHIPCP